MMIARTLRFALRGAWCTSRIRTLITSGLMLAVGCSGPFVAISLKGVTDAALDRNSTRALEWSVVAAVAFLLSLTLENFAHLLYFELADLHGLAMNEELIKLSNGSFAIEQHERPEYADQMELLRGEHYALWSAIEQLMYAISLVAAVGLTAAVLVRLNPLLLALPLFAVPPLIGARRADEHVERARVVSAEETRLARHLFSLSFDARAAKEIRLFGVEQELLRRQDGVYGRVTRRLMQAERHALLMRVSGQLLFALGYLGAIALVVRAAIAGRSTAGDVVLTVTIAGQVSQQVAQTLHIVQSLQKTARAVKRLAWLRRFVDERRPRRPSREIPSHLQHGIVFDRVAFHYPGTAAEVLKSVTLELPAGATVAIVGENGAGKTTLIKLLCRLYEPNEGRITIDGVDLRDLPWEDWRRSIAIAFQDFQRFEFILREVVGVGNVSRIADDEAVSRALQRAAASEIVNQLPAGLMTQLGKSHGNGIDLSGGQWQKLALARAMMRESPLLLILDEPTAALDAHAEHALFTRYAALAQAARQRTGAITLLVSHRFSTVRLADIIVVLGDGRVIEHGSHEELVASGGPYAEMFALQAAAFR